MEDIEIPYHNTYNFFQRCIEPFPHIISYLSYLDLFGLELGLAAAIYTQLSDVEDELNGLVTYDREVVKVDAAAMRELNLGMRRVKYGLISQMHSSKPDV